MIYVAYAAASLCLGVSLLLGFSSSNKKRDSLILGGATVVNNLKGLGECLDNKQIVKNPTVVVHGTVGSTSTVENYRLCVFVKETASVNFEEMNAFGSAVKDSKTILVNLKEVPWYLDDGTGRVYVSDYQRAHGFYDTLKQYVSMEPVSKYFESFVSDEKIKITDVKCSKYRQSLEIGTYLTVVGSAVRDKDGAPMIGEAYQVFSGRIEVDDLVTDLNADSKICDTLSLCLAAVAAVLVTVSMIQNDADVIG